MRMETMGAPSAPAMLFIPGMLCTAQGVRLFAQHMKTEAFFLLPTLSGHYAGAPDYISKEEEAAAILQWLQEHGKTMDELLQAGWDVGVVWQDGRHFHGATHIRLNLASPLSRVQEAMERLDKFVFNA